MPPQECPSSATLACPSVRVRCATTASPSATMRSAVMLGSSASRVWGLALRPTPRWSQLTTVKKSSQGPWQAQASGIRGVPGPP